MNKNIASQSQLMLCLLSTERAWIFIPAWYNYIPTKEHLNAEKSKSLPSPFAKW